MKSRLFIAISLVGFVCAAARTGAAQQSSAASGAVTASSAVPNLIRYSAILKDASGQTLTNLTGVTFLLYQDQEGGSPLWLETQNVAPDKTGHYTVQLGVTNASGLPADLFVNGAPRWLGVQPEGQAEQPRTMLLSVPYALEAGDAQTLAGLPASAFVRTGSNPEGDASTATARGSASPASLSSAPLATSPTGSGTMNFIPLWTTNTNLGNSRMFQSGTNVLFESGTEVGLGTTTPGATLDVLSTAIGMRSRTSTTTANSAAILGTATSATGSTIGMWGINHSIAGFGVVGEATAMSGITVGVEGSSYSPTGFGVVGNGGNSSSSVSAGTGIQGTGGNNSGSGTGGAGLVGNGGSPEGVGVVANGGGVGLVANGGSSGDGSLGRAGITVTGGVGIAMGAGVGADGIDSSGGFGDNADVAPNGGTFFGGGSTGNFGIGIVGYGGSATEAVPGAGGVFQGGGEDGPGSSGDGIDASPGGASDGATAGYAGNFTGNLNVTGAITAGTKDFKIDDPLDPANEYLYHASVESSEMLNLYTGNVSLDATGNAVVHLPSWFEPENKDFRYQLTAIGAPAPGLYVAQEIQNHSFTIAGGAAGQKVSWQVSAVRQDAYAAAHPLQVEVEKPVRERGYYIHPELYGASAEKQIEWARNLGQMRHVKEQRERMQEEQDERKRMFLRNVRARQAATGPTGVSRNRYSTR